jgi:hypothetical protein
LTGGLPTRSLQRFAEEKCLALLLCWLWRLRTQLIDTALTVGNELVAGVLRRAHHGYERIRQEQQKRVEQTLQLCGQVVGLVLDQSVADAQLRETLFQRFSRERLTTLQNDCQELAVPSQLLYLEELRKRYSYVRQFAPRLVETFALRAVIPNEPLLKAVNYLRERNQSGQRGLDENAPLDFVPAKWKPLVCPGGAAKGAVDRAVWEICLLSELSQALKSGNVHVLHSRAFQPVETYLIERTKWATEKAQYAAQLPLDYDVHYRPDLWHHAPARDPLRTAHQGLARSTSLALAGGFAVSAHRGCRRQ